MIVNFLLNSGFQNFNNKNGRGQFNNDFQRFFQEIFNNINNRNNYNKESFNNRNGSYNRNNNHSDNRNYATNSSTMSGNEAFDILGLKNDASPSEIKDAYRKLMLKNHPDYGGSKYISQKINEAKNLLLGK